MQLRRPRSTTIKSWPVLTSRAHLAQRLRRPVSRRVTPAPRRIEQKQRSPNYERYENNYESIDYDMTSGSYEKQPRTPRGFEQRGFKQHDFDEKQDWEYHQDDVFEKQETHIEQWGYTQRDDHEERDWECQQCCPANLN